MGLLEKIGKYKITNNLIIAKCKLKKIDNKPEYFIEHALDLNLLNFVRRGHNKPLRWLMVLKNNCSNTPVFALTDGKDAFIIAPFETTHPQTLREMYNILKDKPKIYTRWKK